MSHAAASPDKRPPAVADQCDERSVRKHYVPPQLEVLGSMAEITLGTTGPNSDGPATSQV